MGAPAEEFGPYLVYEQLGLGGMATVHRAATRGIAGFSKQVALKRMLPNVAADAELVKSFIREAQLASQLHHANIAQTYDLGKVDDTYFIAMELVQGRNVRELVKRCAAIGEPMPLPIVLNIACQVCDALDYAHNLGDESGRPLGIIHRDVSPSNIIVGEAGVVKLIDFGIAKASSSSGMGTMSGTIKGKFSYMAPEYLMGTIDARADLFALGIIMHELLANRPLFQGKDDMDTLYRVRGMQVVPPSRFNPRVPRELDAIVMTALERDPDARWQRANAIRHALTTEAKQLGLLAHNGEVFEWVRDFFGVDSDASISILTPVTESRSTDSLSSLDAQATEIEDPTRLLRNSMAAADTPSDLYDTRPERTPAKRAPSVVARITPVPRATTRASVSELARTTPVSLRSVSSKPRPPVLAEDDDIDGITTLHSDPLGGNTDGDDDDQRETLRPRSEPRAEATARPLTTSAVRTLPGTGSIPRMGTATPVPSAASSIPSTSRGAGVANSLRAVSPLAVAAPRPAELPSSGAQTLPKMSTRAISETVSSVATTVGPSKRSRSSNYMLAVFVLVAAAGAAAVVYFALPYLT